MIIKNYLIIIILFIILLLVYKNIIKYRENFQNQNYFNNEGEYDFLSNFPYYLNNYPSKKITVELSKNIISPLKFVYEFFSESQNYISSRMKEIFPFKFVSYEDIGKNNISILDKINNKVGYICMVHEDIFVDSYLGLKMFRNKKKKNLRYVCSLFYSSFTLITTINSDIKDWGDLKGKTILTYETSQSLDNLVTLLNIMGYQNNDVTIITTNNTDVMKEKFLKREVDSIFVTIPHPSSFIISLSKLIKIKLILKEGLPITSVKFNFPSAFKNKVNMLDYENIISNYNSSESYAIRTVLITNKKTNVKIIYNFIKTIFRNIYFIRGDKLFMKDLSPYFMITALPLVRYHLGVDKFLQEENYVTYSTSNLCNLYTSSQKCSSELINKNRFLTDFSKNNNYEETQYTILDPSGKWNNRINDYDSKTGKFILDSEKYTNMPDNPILISGQNYGTLEKNLPASINGLGIINDNDYTSLYKNFVKQLKYEKMD